MSQIKAWEPQANDRGNYADEAALVAGLRAGRPEAFVVLHGAYAASIYSLALRIVDDQHEAQDVAQEVLIKVFRGLPGDETDLNLPAWLYRVTVNASFDHVRRRKRRPATVAEEAAPESAAVVDEFERADLSRRVESTLRELPKRQQVALVLRDVHGLSVGETASVLGVTKGSADVLLSRARAGFRRVFLAGAGSLAGRCPEADRALAAGVGRGEPAPASLMEHAKTCPDCRPAVELWSAAPIGLGLLLPQVTLPAKLGLGAMLAAVQAAGVAVPAAGLGATAAAGAASPAAAASSFTGAGAAVAPAVGTVSAGSAATGGLLGTLGSAAGVKIATLAIVATAALGAGDVAMHHAHADALRASTNAAAQAMSARGAGSPAGGRAGLLAGERARELAAAHRGAAGLGSGADGVGSGGLSAGAGKGDAVQSGSPAAGTGQAGSAAATGGSGGASGGGTASGSATGEDPGTSGSGTGGSTGTGGSGTGGSEHGRQRHGRQRHGRQRHGRHRRQRHWWRERQRVGWRRDWLRGDGQPGLTGARTRSAAGATPAVTGTSPSASPSTSSAKRPARGRRPAGGSAGRSSSSLHVK